MGPRIEPVCQLSEFQATARGSSSRGTSIGPMAPCAGDRKAREAPNSTATPKISGRSGAGRSACSASTATSTASTPRHTAAISRRG